MHQPALKKYLALFSAFCCAACAPAHHARPPGASAVASVSRVVIPANGGQTIQEPRNMGDTFTLWGPPGRSYAGRGPDGPSARGAQRGAPAANGATGGATIWAIGGAAGSPTGEIPAGIPAGTANLAAKARPNGPAGRAGLAVQDIPAWLPATEQEIMQRYLYRFTHEQKELAARVLARAKIYLPVALEEVTRRGLPPELACLPLVESAFEPTAVSRAGAAGLWQLMPETARRFGLVVNSELDERFDARKSTEAATAYLAYLYGLFSDWPLALAAYNCGEGAMLGAMGKANCENLNNLTAYCRATESGSAPLREETLRFVPQFAAAVLLMTRAEEFGFGPIMPPEAGNLNRMAGMMDKAAIVVQPVPPGKAGITSETEMPSLAGGAGVPSPAANKQNLPEKLALSGRYESGPEEPTAQPPRSMRMQ